MKERSELGLSAEKWSQCFARHLEVIYFVVFRGLSVMEKSSISIKYYRYQVLSREKRKEKRRKRKTMKKRALILCPILFLMIVAMIPITMSQVPRVDHLIEVSIGGPESVDPCWAYDVDSHTLCQQVYDPVIWFGRNVTETANEDTKNVAGKPNEFDPWLATDWWVSDDNLNFTFRIRGTSGSHDMESTNGVDWHETSPWTCTDWELTDGTIAVDEQIELTRDAIIVGPGAVAKKVRQYFTVDSCDLGASPKTMTVDENPVKWQDSYYGTLDVYDVEYSWKRLLVLDRSGGPSALLYGPLLGASRADYSDPNWDVKINNAIVVNNATCISLYCEQFYVPGGFQQIIAQDWTAVTCKDWCIAQNCWDGDFDKTAKTDVSVGTGDGTTTEFNFPDKYPAGETIYVDGSPIDPSNYTMNYPEGSVEFTAFVPGAGEAITADYTWMQFMEEYRDPPVSPIDDAGWPMMGCGPYELDYWTHGVEWSVVKFDDYWQGWPAPGSDSNVDRFTTKFIEEWATRKFMFLRGDADLCYVPRPNIAEVEGQPGIRCVFPCSAIHQQNVFWGFNVSLASPYIGSDGWLASGTFSEFGQPPDLFSDEDVRKAFMYSFDWCTYIGDVLLGEAIQPATHHPMGLAYYNPSPSGTRTAYAENATCYWTPPAGTGPYPWEFDLAKAEEHFKTAYGGSVGSPGPLWTNGTTIYMLYIEGSVEGEAATYMLKENVESLNDLFHIEPTPVSFGDFLTALFSRWCPLDQIGWTADYIDPDNFAHPYLHTDGTISWCHCFSNATVDALIEAAAVEPNTTLREEMYHELQWMSRQNLPNLPLFQVYGRHWERTWVQGWYYNCLLPGPYAYLYWKGVEVAMEPVDVSAQSSITVHDDAYPTEHPDCPIFPVEVSIERVDSNTGVAGFMAVIACSRTNATGYEVVIDVDMKWMGAPGSTVTSTFDWLETDATLEAGDYEMAGIGGVASGSVYDENEANDEIVEEAFNVTVDWTLPIVRGDFDYNGEVDEDDLWHFCGEFIAYYKGVPWDPACDFDGDVDLDEDDLWKFCEMFIDYWKYC